jgi:hypothetical protein
VSPSVTVTGKTIQIEVRGFHANEPVLISFDPAPIPGNKTQQATTPPPTSGTTIITDKRGRGKIKFVVTQAPGRWVVSAIGTVPDSSGAMRSSATILKVVLKK